MDDHEDNHARLTGPSHRMTAPANRGTRVEKTPSLADVKRWASKESLDEARRAAMRDASDTAAVRVCIFDLDGVIYGEQPKIARLVERQLNRLGDQSPPVFKDVLRKQGIAFRAVFADGEPSSGTKARFHPVDYPIYVLRDQMPPYKDIERLHRIMSEQRIPKYIVGSTVETYASVTESWAKSGLRGVSVAPGFGKMAHAKCAFLKGSRMVKESRNANYFTNVLLHEFGHMNNIYRPGHAHPFDGSVMDTNVPLRTLEHGVIDYNPGHAQQIVVQLVRIWAIQRAS